MELTADDLDEVRSGDDCVVTGFWVVVRENFAVFRQPGALPETASC